MSKTKAILLSTIVAVCLSGGMDAAAQKKSKTRAQKSQTTATKKKKTAQKKNETSADVERKAEATRLEIAKTKEQIKVNDAAIKKNLASLSQISADIDVSKKQIAGIATQVNSLSNKIDTYEADIAEREERIAVMREKYRNALKKLRLKKGHTGTLAFIFSSDNFNQALRRLRYLRQFAKWRDSQTQQITNEVAALRKEREELTATKEQHSQALVNQRKTQEKLEGQYSKQDAIVANLKQNGRALNEHLARKQSEANELRNRISALIAAEREAERRAEEKRQAEAKRKAEAEAKRKAEAEAKRKAEAEAQEKRLAEAKPKEQTPQKPPQTQKSPDKQKERSYADARKCNPRKEATAPSKPLPAPVKAEQKPTKQAQPKQVAQEKNASDFASNKGRLPRPSSNGFKVVSKFGPHPLPDLPAVTYDNPGIDAEVTPGASAVAVYGGTVSGVYVVKGFSTVIIINHGTHYTVYGNLSSTAVKKGDKVRQGQALGRVASDADDGNRSILHFEVWRGRDKLNPQEWIK